MAYKIEIKWALLFVVMGLVWMYLEKLVGLHSTHIAQHPIYTNFIAIPAIALYVFALRDKKYNFYNGTISFKQAFITGLMITAVVTLLSPLSQVITSTLITPEYFPNVIKYSVEHNLLSEEAAKEYFSLKNYIIQSLIFAPVMGIITSAIVAYFIKSKKTNTTEK